MNPVEITNLFSRETLAKKAVASVPEAYKSYKCNKKNIKVHYIVKYICIKGTGTGNSSILGEEERQLQTPIKVSFKNLHFIFISTDWDQTLKL